MTGKNLQALNKKRSTGYDKYDSGSVEQYNEIVYEYNDIIKYQNKLSQEYNSLKNSYNALIPEISPSNNIAFTSCLNSKLLQLETNVTSLNIDTLNLKTENFKINTENLRKNLE